jgi:ATP-dependent helicase/nuclease subunit B
MIFAPAAEAEAFDEGGRPRVPAWRGRELVLPDFIHQVHLEADPAGQADRIAALVRDYAKNSAGARDASSGRLGVGMADPEVLPLLESALARAGFPVFNPEGRARRGDRLYQLLAALGPLTQDPAFETVGALARCPDFIAFLATRGGPEFSAARWLGGLDELHSRHLPAGLSAARLQAPKLTLFPELVPGLAAIEEVRALLTGGSFAAGASAALGAIFSERRLDLAREAEAQLEESALAWRKIVQE